jgi:hypothetical protein
MSVLRGAQSSLEAFSGSRSKEPDRDPHHVPLRNLPSSYCSGAQHPRTTPLLVPIRSSSIRVLFPVRTIPELPTHVLFHSPYQSPAHHFHTTPLLVPVPSSVILSIDQLSVFGSPGYSSSSQVLTHCSPGCSPPAHPGPHPLLTRYPRTA